VVHLRTLEIAAQHHFRFDAVQMPLNVMDAHFRSFEHDVLPRLVHDRIGVLGMKSLGEGKLLESQTASAIECLHYALNLPTSVVITGIDRPEILDQAIEAARTFRPMDRATVRALLARTATAAATGRYELFKTSDRYDAKIEELGFDLVDADGRHLPVVYRGVRPGNFKDAISIVAIGRYHEGRIEAEKLLVKCPSKYQGAEVEKAYASKPAPGKTS
jgi:hypothetical protein